jgi:hypothetical protein
MQVGLFLYSHNNGISFLLQIDDKLDSHRIGYIGLSNRNPHIVYMVNNHGGFEK